VASSIKALEAKRENEKKLATAKTADAS